MNTDDSSFNHFLQLLNCYPSPHNGQPVRLKQVDSRQFEAFFQLERGLQSTDISFIFSFVSMGVFMEYASACASALGHTLNYKLLLPREQELRGQGLVKFAEIKLDLHAQAPNNSLVHALNFRQTSRKKYSEGLSPTLSDEIMQIALDAKMNLRKLSKQQASGAIWLNQRAVFDDMFDPAVCKELDHWLRYSKAEKESKLDGLAYDCMGMNGRIMKFIVHHPHILRMPGIAGLIKSYYLRTMTDNSDVFYMMAPFSNESEAFAVGTIIAKVWIGLSQEGYYLHPFGTIMSNQAAHRDFIKLALEDNETREHSYLVFIFRAGKSEIPVKSLRLPYDQHLIMR